MIDHLQRGLWEARQKIVVFSLLLAAVLMIIVVVAGLAVIRTSAGAKEQDVLGVAVPINGKVQAITESITCIAAQCPQVEGAATFLNTIIAPTAMYTTDGVTSHALVPGDSRWRNTAISITGDGPIEGTATSIQPEGLRADFEWDGTKWSAEFGVEGDTQKLMSLTKQAS